MATVVKVAQIENGIFSEHRGPSLSAPGLGHGGPWSTQFHVGRVLCARYHWPREQSSGTWGLGNLWRAACFHQPPCLGPGGLRRRPSTGSGVERAWDGGPLRTHDALCCRGHGASGPQLSGRGGGGRLEAKPLCSANLKINRSATKIYVSITAHKLFKQPARAEGAPVREPPRLHARVATRRTASQLAALWPGRAAVDFN